jgi:hypothetical protein
MSGSLHPYVSVVTLAHEVAHALMHEGFEGSRDQAELEAESVAYIVCAELGIDSAEYTFGYVASWGGGEGAADRVRQSGQRIQHAAQTILTSLGVAAEPAA